MYTRSPALIWTFPSTQTPSQKMSTLSAANCETTPEQDSTESEEQQTPKSCRECPDTKSAMDACIIERGEESCTDLIEAHKECQGLASPGGRAGLGCGCDLEMRVCARVQKLAGVPVKAAFATSSPLLLQWVLLSVRMPVL
ncbi:hypothetical protein AAFF_G00308270 [Aldrovandia affinis]|uniref:Cytochrome c oxidase copper chaperone n=1 Tax=Aldrovandia affinis TaxID=143900 RepID=A0AAD7SNI6_9TELE|nr:hypothetical protein AAFF_G00308270 [Aldrovandia affinis]